MFYYWLQNLIQRPKSLIIWELITERRSKAYETNASKTSAALFKWLFGWLSHRHWLTVEYNWTHISQRICTLFASLIRAVSLVPLISMLLCDKWRQLSVKTIVGSLITLGFRFSCFCLLYLFVNWFENNWRENVIKQNQFCIETVISFLMPRIWEQLVLQLLNKYWIEMFS